MSILPAADEREDSWPQPLPRVLSPTSITTAQCFEQWRRVYVCGETSRVSGALVIGSADSDAAAHNYEQKIASHEDLPVADVEYVAADSFEKRCAETEVAWEDKAGERDPGEALDTTIRVVRAYHAQVAPSTQPTMVEAAVEFQVEGAPLVRAYVDLTTEGRIVSRKTSARAASTPKAAWRLQSAIEGAALGGMATDYHIAVKGQVPKMLTPVNTPGLVSNEDGRAAERAAQAISTTTRAIRALYEEFGPDEHWPTPAALHFGASICMFCAFKPTCPAWA